MQSCSELLLTCELSSSVSQIGGGWLLSADSWDVLYVQKSTQPGEVNLHFA